MCRLPRDLFVDTQERYASPEVQASVMVPPNADTGVAEAHGEVIPGTCSPREIVDLLTHLGGQVEESEGLDAVDGAAEVVVGAGNREMVSDSGLEVIYDWKQSCCWSASPWSFY